jgi:murein L,D-transpeptidase YcbB/YkuD
MAVLADAASDGMVPADYRTQALVRQADALVQSPSAAGQPEFAAALDAAMLHYLRELARGRVDPRSLGFRVARLPEPAHDLLAQLHAAAAEHRLAELVARQRPRLAQYAKLREALGHYRTLAAAAPTAPVPTLARANTRIEPGDAYAGADTLQQRLLALGDLDAKAALPPDGRYTPALAEAVRRFQARHGLEPDGVIGRGTLAALNVPLERRVQQLELALERLRWLPDLGGGPFVGINIPMFRLWAWDPAMPAGSGINMGVVVGKALNTQTPVLAQDMRYLIFRPYWNVPSSILRNEVLPALARNPDYLRRHDMELVRGPGDDSPAVEASAANLALLRQGVLRVRQRPGPKNSLGLVKFIFPNDNNVYLHDTPATQLFGRARRDFSHGCVRVEDPPALARWVLRDQPAWTPERIRAAMHGTTQQRVNLTRPVPVILFYVTAMVLPDSAAPHFAQDIYGHDARLAHALAQRQAP